MLCWFWSPSWRRQCSLEWDLDKQEKLCDLVNNSPASAPAFFLCLAYPFEERGQKKADFLSMETWSKPWAGSLPRQTLWPRAPHFIAFVCNICIWERTRQMEWSHSPLRFWSLLILKAYMKPSQWQVPWSQSHLSHILDTICHYYKCSNFFQFYNILSHFLWFLDCHWILRFTCQLSSRIASHNLNYTLFYFSVYKSTFNSLLFSTYFCFCFFFPM